MEMQEQFEALVAKGVAKALSPYKEAIIALAKLVNEAEPDAPEKRMEAPRAKRKATGPRVNKKAIEEAKKFNPGQPVIYKQGRGNFGATVEKIDATTGVLTLRRATDGNIVKRPAEKVEVV